MNTNDFTKAARAEAERRYPALNPDAEELTYPRSALREHKRSAHVAGWEAARTHLAAQEPTDAEVEAAAVALAVEGDDLGEWDSLSTYAQATYLRDARAALSAARADQAEAERDHARAQVDRVRELLTKWVDEYGDPVYRGNGWAEGVRDAAREALKAMDGER